MGQVWRDMSQTYMGKWDELRRASWLAQVRLAEGPVSPTPNALLFISRSNQQHLTSLNVKRCDFITPSLCCTPCCRCDRLWVFIPNANVFAVSPVAGGGRGCDVWAMGGGRGGRGTLQTNPTSDGWQVGRSLSTHPCLQKRKSISPATS